MNSAGAGIDAAPRVLVTGFEPFGGESVNPSWEVARALHGAQIAGAQVYFTERTWPEFDAAELDAALALAGS